MRRPLFWERRDNHGMAMNLIRLGDLLSQGYPLDAALSFLNLHMKKTDKDQFLIVQEELRTGRMISEAFECLNLPKDVLAFLYFYEQQGDLAGGFKQAGTIYLKKEATKKEIAKIVRYPLILIWLSFLMLLLLNQFVAPHFNQLFHTFQGTPPLITNLFFRFIELLPLVTFLSLFFLALLFIYYFFVIHKWSPVKKINFLLKVRPIASSVKEILTYFFALQYGRSLEAGMSLKEVLDLFEKQTILLFYQIEATEMKNELQIGESFYSIIKRKTHYVPELALVIENGEKTGYLAKDLQSYSQLLYLDLEKKLQKVFTLMQPIFFIGMGLFVLIMFLAVMLPMFQLMNTIQ